MERWLSQGYLLLLKSAHGFGFQQPKWQSTTICNYSYMGIWDLVHIHTCRQNHPYIHKENLYRNEQRKIIRAGQSTVKLEFIPML